MAVVYNLTVQPGVARTVQVYGNADETYQLKNLGPATLQLAMSSVASPSLADPRTAYPLSPGEAVLVPYPALNAAQLPTLSVSDLQADQASRVVIVAR